MKSLAKVKMMRWGLLSGVSALLIGLVVYGVLKPDPEEQEYNRIKTLILSSSSEPGSPEDRMERRQEFRKLAEKLKPETRERLMTEIMRQRLYEAREKTKDLSEQEKQAKVDEMIVRVREGFEKLNPEQREHIKQDINSEEGKKRMKKSMDFYFTEFTPEERKRLDPLVNEILTKLDSL